MNSYQTKNNLSCSKKPKFDQKNIRYLTFPLHIDCIILFQFKIVSSDWPQCNDKEWPEGRWSRQEYSAKIQIIKSKTSEKFTAITPSWISLIIFAHKSQMTWFWNVDDYWLNLKPLENKFKNDIKRGLTLFKFYPWKKYLFEHFTIDWN